MAVFASRSRPGAIILGIYGLARIATFYETQMFVSWFFHTQ